MYELADWGSPVAPAELAQLDRVITHLPHTLVRVLRSRARAQGISIDTLVDRLLHEALAMPGHQQHPRMVTAVD
jgi:hypothetical protein